MAGMMGTLRTVLAAMLGVRRKADHLRESEPLNPVHIVIAGVAMGVLFVLTLVVVVRFVVG